MSDIIQRLFNGELTKEEKAGLSKYNQQFNQPEEREPVEVNFALGKEQRIAIYQDVKDLIDSGAPSHEVARSIVLCMEEHLQEKQSEAYGSSNAKLKGGKGGFRRVE